MKHIYVDLDGVLNRYDGWKGADHWPEMRPGAREFLEELNRRGFTVVVFTTRAAIRAEAWLRANGLMPLVAEVTHEKGPAVAYIDDRGLKFEGSFEDTLEALHSFRAHWES